MCDPEQTEWQFQEGRFCLLIKNFLAVAAVQRKSCHGRWRAFRLQKPKYGSLGTEKARQHWKVFALKGEGPPVFLPRKWMRLGHCSSAA